MAAKIVTNKSRRPLSIPLPGGKKLHLGPGKTGQIAANAAERPELKKLVEAGEIEIFDEGARAGERAAAGKGARPWTGGHASGGTGHRGGDR